MLITGHDLQYIPHAATSTLLMSFKSSFYLK
jgi:hypothetical protein